MKKAVIILPTYNERENVRITIPRLVEVFKDIKDWTMEILVVDDTSPDKTYEVIKKMQKKYKLLHLVLNKKKSGLGGAYLKGMKYAFGTLKADVVFEFDADLSHDPTKIPVFLEKIDQGAEMVLGNRYIKGGSIPQDWGIHRKFLSVVGNLVIMTVFGSFKIKDWTSGYRAITKPVYDAVHKHLKSDQFSGYTFQIGFLYHALRKGFRIDPNVAYNFTDREIGESKIGPEYLKNTLIFIFKMRYLEIVNNRLFKFAMTGGIGAVVQAVTLALGRMVFPYQLAYFIGVEAAVASNFIISNIWTFSDKKLAWPQIPKKFLQFNLASAGSIAIQQVLAFFLETIMKVDPDSVMIKVPTGLTTINIDNGFVIMVVGILLGMCWNFFAYTRLIWKTHTK